MCLFFSDDVTHYVIHYVIIFFFDYVIYYVIGKNFVYKKFLKIFFQYRGYPFQLNYEIKNYEKFFQYKKVIFYKL